MDSIDQDRYEALWWLSREQELECDDPECDLCLPAEQEPDDG